MNKLKVGLIYGGKSFEHEVSLKTAESIAENIDREKFEVKKIFIDKNGQFAEKLLQDIDIAFLAVHGPNCEDGKLQQYLEDRGIKYTGSGVETSRLNMDKVRMHDAFRAASIRTAKYLQVKKGEQTAEIDQKIRGHFGYPCFTKPNNVGSSIGISKIMNSQDLAKALEEAYQHDNEVEIEQAIEGCRDIELGILGNDKIIISDAGVIHHHDEFYTYEAKYFSHNTAIKLGEINTELNKKAQDLAKKAYQVTGCRGYSRVDLFLSQDNKLYLNEINTLPGFTATSMYPKLMAAAGIPYRELITRIIELALV